MRVWTLPLAALLAAATAAAARPPGGDACSTGRIHGVRTELFVLATAGADTVRAGPGPIRYGPQPVDPASLESIHGQRFRLDRVGGDVPVELAGAEGGEAVLVPYGSECRDVWRWSRARWAEPGRRVFADASLRPREQWVDGVPTFDVEMVHDVYPEGYTRMTDDDSLALMTPEEAFDFTRLLPTFDEAQAAPAPAYRRLLAWARGNPALAARFPATRALAEASDALQPCVPPHDPHPVAGTYRASVILERTDTLTFLFQTDARGHPLCAPAELRLDLAEVRPRMADTARLYLRGAADEAALEAAPPGAGARPGCGGGSVDVANAPRGEADARAWGADYNYAAIPSCFPAVPRANAIGEALFAAYVAGDRSDVPGRFVEAGGEMRFEQSWRAGGRVLLEMRAARVGPRTMGLR